MIRSNKKTLQIVLIVLVLLPLISATAFQAYGMLGNDNQFLSKDDTDVFFDSFDNTAYRDFVETDAIGWGTGTITNERDFSWEVLDFYATPNPVRGLEVQGRKAYVAMPNSIASPFTVLALDITDLNDIQFMSQRDSLDYTITLAVDGDTVYTGRTDAAIPQKFNTYNVSDPTNLDGSGVYQDYFAAEGTLSDIDIEGKYAYFTAFNSSVDRSFGVVDIEDPDNIQYISNNWVSNRALGLDVEGRLAYIAASTDGLYILNVTDVSAPVEIGFVSTVGNATDVIVDGRFAYIAGGTAGLQIINIQDPTNPVLVGSYNTPGYAHRLVKQGRTIFMACGLSGIIIIDVADPYNPSYVAQRLENYVWDIALYGDAILIGTNLGVHAFRFGSMTDLSTSLFGIYSDKEAWDVRVRDGIAFVAGGPDGFYILDVRDPNSPQLLYSYTVTTQFYKLDINEQYAFLVHDNGLYIFDISDLTNVQMIRYALGIHLTDVHVQGHYVFASHAIGFAILNITNIYATTWDVHNLGYTNVTAIWVQGYHVYLTQWLGGSASCLHVYNIIDHAAPYPVYSRMRYAYNYDVKVNGDTLYLAGHDDGNGMWMYNVTNPTIMYVVDNVYRNNYGVWDFGQYVLTADYTDGVALINATTPTNVVVDSAYAGATGAIQIMTEGDYTYVANTTSLVILRHYESAGDTYVDVNNLAQSNSIFTMPNGTISAATLVVDYYNPSPNPTSLLFEMTSDGVNWESVTPNVLHTFTNAGTDLRWRATLNGETYLSPHIYSVEITYDFDYARPSPPGLSPLWIGIIAGGAGLVLIIIIIVIAVTVSKKKKIATR
ncbi:MAG: hypothetical protein ACTSO7_07880 [Candidatus Heimdallarchaeota archaeon]